MKRKIKCLVYPLAVIAIGFFAITSCSDDEKESDLVSENHFAYDGEFFDLSHGLLAYEGYSIELLLFSEGIVFDDQHSTYYGEGPMIVFAGYSPDENNLAEGTYNIVLEETGEPFTFDLALLWINFNFDDPDFDSQIESHIPIQVGDVQVERSGATYTITIDAMAENGKAVSGYYEGFLRVELYLRVYQCLTSKVHHLFMLQCGQHHHH